MGGEDEDLDETRRNKMKDYMGEEKANEMENDMKEMGRRRKDAEQKMKEWMGKQDNDWKKENYDMEKGEMKDGARDMFMEMFMDKHMELEESEYEKDEKMCKEKGDKFMKDDEEKDEDSK